MVIGALVADVLCTLAAAGVTRVAQIVADDSWRDRWH